MKPVVDAHYQILLRFPETYVRNDVLLEATEEQWQNYGELPFEVEPKAEVLKRISGKMTSTD